MVEVALSFPMVAWHQRGWRLSAQSVALAPVPLDSLTVLAALVAALLDSLSADVLHPQVSGPASAPQRLDLGNEAGRETGPPS